MQTGYSENKIRLWGFLAGVGFALGIASTILAIWADQLKTVWIVLTALGFGLFFGAILGLWLELRKVKH